MKNLDLKNYKVLMGLFTLLFLTSIVQAGTMLKVKKLDQTAQVKDALTVKGGNLNTKDNLIDTIQPPRGESSECLEYNFSFDRTQTYAEYIANAPAYVQVESYFTLRNICDHNVNIINPVSLNKSSTTAFNPMYLEVQRYLGSDNFEPVNIQINNTQNGQQLFDLLTSQNHEILNCSNCAPGVNGNITTSYVSGSSAPQTLNAYSLAPNQTGNFILTGVASPTTVAIANGRFISSPFRYLTKKFLWFKDGSMNDNIVQSGEVLTHNLTPVEIKESTHDVIQMYY